MIGGLGNEDDKFETKNLSAAGDHTAIAATTTQTIFVAPKRCVILDVLIGVTTTITTHSSNIWTISLTNRTGTTALLSSNFNTDSDLTGNGGRAITADTLVSLSRNSTGTSYLQNAVLEEGDHLQITLTKGSSASNLTYPTALVKYRI